MAAVIVVPFDVNGKSRLPEAIRASVAQAMLEDVLAACRPVADTLVADAEGGQGAAVQQALEPLQGVVAVVNADLPCATAEDLQALLAAIPEGGIAVAPAEDGTTNALGLATPELFAPLYGPGSAEEFRAHASQLGVASVTVSRPNLTDDVDTEADLARLGDRVGSNTRAAL